MRERAGVPGGPLPAQVSDAFPGQGKTTPWRGMCSQRRGTGAGPTTLRTSALVPPGALFRVNGRLPLPEPPCRGGDLPGQVGCLFVRQNFSGMNLNGNSISW